MLNVHPSLLPRWRGAAPIERAMMAGDETTGVTIMRVTAGLDSGPVALAEEVPVARRRRLRRPLGAARRARRASSWSGRSTALAAEQLEFTEQDEADATYAEKISPGGAPPRPGAPARRSSSGSCGALTPHIGAYLELDDGSDSACDRRVPSPRARRRARSRSGRATCCSARRTGLSGSTWSNPPERSR